MKKAVLYLSLSILMLVAGAAQSAEVLRVVASPWPPYSDQGLPKKGLSMELVRAALIRAGYKPEIYLESWPRTLEGAEIGVYDVIAAAWYSKEREAKFDFSEPYLNNRVRLLKHDESGFKFDSLDDLAGLRVGVVRDFAYGEKFDNATNFTKVYQNHVIQNLLKLVNRQVDLVIGDELTIRHQIREYMPQEEAHLEFLPKAILVKGLHIAVSRKRADHAEIVAGFNEAIKIMKADGSYQLILDKHLKSLTEAPN